MPKTQRDGPALSVVVLAGGQSSRMGRDKAFLALRGRPFIAMITDEMLKLSDDVLVMIGDKRAEGFRAVLDGRVRVAPDGTFLTNPMGGMLSAFPLLAHGYAAFLACDTPFVRAGVVEYLGRSAMGHDAAVPRWEDGRIEPLCAVYSVAKAKEAGAKALAGSRWGCRELIGFLNDVSYIDVGALRSIDPALVSFRNVNSPEEYDSFNKGG